MLSLPHCCAVTPSDAHHPELTRQYVKLCDLPDFDDPRLRAMLRDIAPGHDEHAELHRKFWEYAMLGMYLEDVGALRDDARVLAVAAGHEEPLFWLANRVARVVATDIYGDGGFAVPGREADASMLTDPASFAPYPYREDHLEVQHMNALDLQFDDDTFDVTFSLSSIEHFGSPANFRQAAAEMARVTRPGGHVIIVTEVLLGRRLLDEPLVNYAIKLATAGRLASTARPDKRAQDAFTPKELQRDIIAPVGAALVQPMDMNLAPASYDNLIAWGTDGTLTPRSGDPYPHIMLQAHGSPWTSAFLAFQV